MNAVVSTGFLNWLGENVAIAQFIAYTAFTATTVTVAFLSLRYSHRQNFGWKPLLLLVNRNFKSDIVENTSEGAVGVKTLVSIEFDIWNRRTYPIVVDGAIVSFTQDIFCDEKVGVLIDGNEWINIEPSEFVMNERFVLDGGKHRTIFLIAKLRDGQRIQDVAGDMNISMGYFDTRSRKRIALRVGGAFNFDFLDRRKRGLISVAQGILRDIKDARREMSS